MKLTRAITNAATPASAPPVAAAPLEDSSANLLKMIQDTLDDAKAENTLAIDLIGKTSLADAMVVTTGRSNRHVSAIADQVVEANPSAIGS